MNFIVLSTGRSGTNFLKELLNYQSDVFCAGEIFSHTLDNLYLKSNILKQADLVKQANISLKEWSNNETQLIKKYTDIKNFVDIGCNNYINSVYKGFKILYGQIKMGNNFNENFTEDFLNFLKEQNYKVILLERKNLFMRTLSLQMLKRKKNDNAKNGKINFNVKKYLKKKNKGNDADVYKNLLEAQNISLVYITYEDLLKNTKETLKTVIEFLKNNTNEEVVLPLEFKNKKLNVFTLKDQLFNFDEIREKLKDDPYFIEAFNAKPGTL